MKSKWLAVLLFNLNLFDEEIRTSTKPIMFLKNAARSFSARPISIIGSGLRLWHGHRTLRPQYELVQAMKIFITVVLDFDLATDAVLV
jgi:hypothetical protein